jgi:hypothetical protein
MKKCQQPRTFQSVEQVFAARGHTRETQTQARTVLDGFVLEIAQSLQQVIGVFTAVVGVNQAQSGTISRQSKY